MREHVGYPHTPGTLYECLACEAECFCEGSLVDMCLCCSNEFYSELLEEE